MTKIVSGYILWSGVLGVHYDGHWEYFETEEDAIATIESDMASRLYRGEKFRLYKSEEIPVNLDKK